MSASGRGRPFWQSRDRGSRLLLGDQAGLLAGLPEESVDCIWTDPPYFLSNDGSTCIAGRRESVNKGGWDKSAGIEADHAFNREWLAQCLRVLTPAGTIWVTGTLHVYLSVGMAMQELGFRILNDIVWEKPNPPPNLGCRCFTHATEMMFWATKAPRGSRHKHTFNYEAMKAMAEGKQMKNVWRMPSAGRTEKAHGRHPTQKPVALIERCLLASTNPGDHVLDPFAGSGSTGVAALGIGRRFTGMEIDPEFAGMARARLDAGDTTARPARKLAR